MKSLLLVGLFLSVNAMAGDKLIAKKDILVEANVSSTSIQETGMEDTYCDISHDAKVYKRKISKGSAFSIANFRSEKAKKATVEELKQGLKERFQIEITTTPQTTPEDIITYIADRFAISYQFLPYKNTVYVQSEKSSEIYPIICLSKHQFSREQILLLLNAATSFALDPEL